MALFCPLDNNDIARHRVCLRNRPMDLLCETSFECPYCGEGISITVDTSQGGYSTIEDCTVCCRPIQLVFECEPGEVIAVEASAA